MLFIFFLEEKWTIIHESRMSGCQIESRGRWFVSIYNIIGVVDTLRKEGQTA